MARLTAEDGSVTAVVLDSHDGGFRGELPAQPPGLHEVEVLARAVPEVGDLSSTEMIAVVDEAAGD